MRFTTLFVLIFSFALLSSGSLLYYDHLENNTVDSNFTMNMSWDYECNMTGSRVRQFVCKITDLVGWSAMEGGNFLVEYGYENPMFTYSNVMDFLVFVLWVSLVAALVPLIKFGIVFGYIVYDWYKSRRKKK